jgi:carbamoyltransferase
VILLAVHTMGHDTGACLFDGSRLVFAIETERLTRVKHDHRAQIALDHVFEQSGVAPDRIELLVFTTNVRNRLARIDDFERLHRSIEDGRLEARGWSDLLGWRVPCLIVAHEASHAVLACHAARFPDPCLVVVNEGRGTFSRNCSFVHRRGRLELVDRDALPWYGTGFGWSVLSYLLGLGHNPSAAGKTMAMAAYGARSATAESLLTGLDERLHDRPRERQLEIARPLLNYVARAREFGARADLMRTFQELFTETFAGYCRRQLAAHGCRRLALGGGCALNIHANPFVRREIAPQLAIPPNCGDSGQALGAAVYALAFQLGIEPEAFDVYRCGAALSDDEARAAGEEASLRLEPLEPAAVALRLARGEVVALAQGRSELGPRALGNRSLLGSASAPGMRERMSERLKAREWFRPLACAVRDERFRELFAGEPPSPHMLFQYRMPDGLAPEATHVDGTSRIQTLTREGNPLLWELLDAYERETGEAALINTSLNGPGRAIALGARHVLDDFLDQDVDVFVFNDWIASRPPADARARRPAQICA